MADTDDQNTPNADISQSIDEAGEHDAGGLVAGDQVSEMNEKKSSNGPKVPDGRPRAATQTAKAAPRRFDQSTLIGRLESKLAAISDVLGEKEGLQMSYTFGDDIREEYYRRWKAEGNSFLILATRLKRRLDKERAHARKGSA